MLLAIVARRYLMETNPNNYNLRLGAWSEMRDIALPLRIEVFVQEQHVPIALEQDEYDDQALHAIIVTNDGTGLATGRLMANGKIGRLAVKRQHRGQGLGKHVLQTLINQARVRGARLVWLHAQCDTKAFYEAFGFLAQGDPFVEAGIWHVRMVRTVNGVEPAGTAS
jgi:predicted GNAT family N-acyltransferase